MVVLLIACSFFCISVPSAKADPVPAGSQVTLLDQDFALQPGIPKNVVLGNHFPNDATATLNYVNGAIEYKKSGSQNGVMYVGIEPFIDGNLSFSVKVSSDHWYSNVYIVGSTFMIQTQTRADGSATVNSIYQTSPTTIAYKTYNVPVSALKNGVNTINIEISGTSKTVRVYHDSSRSVSTPMYHTSVQRLPYAPMTLPIVMFSNEKSSLATWVSTSLYAVKEKVYGGLVTPAPGDDFVPFGFDNPGASFNGNGAQYMNARGHKGVAWVDLGWLEYQPQLIEHTNSLLAAGWELGIHFNNTLTSMPLAQAQAHMRDQYNQVTQIFGRPPTTWGSFQNADNVTLAAFAYNELRMIWRNGYSFNGYIPNIGNLEEDNWNLFWSRISGAQMIYPSFTHATDQEVAEPYSISYSSFTTWVNNYDGKHIIGFYEYYYRTRNQIDTKINYLNYTNGTYLKFSVQCNLFQTRLLINFTDVANATILKNGSPLVANSSYTVINSSRVALFANSGDIFEIRSNGSVPGAPQNLTATAGNARVNLSWSPPSVNGSSVTNYTIYRGNTSGNETLLTTLGNVTNYTDTSVSNGQTYYYQVSATNAAGEGNRSNEANATPRLSSAVPSAPLNLTAAAGNSQVTLNWSAPASNGGSNITNYTVYRGTTSNNETRLANLSNVTTFNDTAVSNGTTYYYKVSATNEAGEGNLSNEASATLAVVPSAPQNLTATANVTQIALNWSQPSSSGGSAITSYKVYRGEASGGETLLTTLGNLTRFNDSSVASGRIYYYKVSAVNSLGEGPQSGEVSATITGVPSTPRNLTATAGDVQVVLKWEAPSSNGSAAITNYKIYRGNSSGGEELLITIGNLLNYTDTAVSNGQTYYYKVSAINSAGEGNLSSEVSAMPSSAGTVPSAPQDLSATAGNAQVSLNWTAPSTDGGAAIDHYLIYRDGEEIAQTNNTSYIDHGLTNGQIYSFAVAAHNSYGTGEKSASVQATPTASLPGAPTGLKATPGIGLMQLSWEAPSGEVAVDYYIVYQDNVDVAHPADLTTTISGLVAGQTYVFEVAAHSADGTGPRSSSVQAAPLADLPGAPTALTATPGDRQVDLNWTAPAEGATGIDYYVVYQDGTELPDHPTGTSTTVTGLTNGHTYNFTVAAHKADGIGPQSGPAQATPGAIPGAPTDLKATPGDGEVALSWVAPSDDGGSPIDYYVVYQDEVALETHPTETSLTVSDLSSGQSYSFKVAAHNSVGMGAQSEAASATLLGTPGAPTGLAAKASGTSVALNWTAPENDGGAAIDYYLVKTDGTMGETHYTGLNTTISGLSSGLHRFAVAAHNSAGLGPESDEVTATISLNAPGAPTNLTATAGNAQVSLSWTAPANTGDGSVDYYVVYQNGGELTSHPAGTSATITGLTNGQTYSFYVKAHSAGGLGPQSNQVNATPSSISVKTPSTNATWYRNTTYTITWTAGVTGNLRIELVQGTKVISTIAANTANDGTENWRVPYTTPTGSGYQVKISSVSNSNDAALSPGKLTISNPTVNVTSPDSKSALVAGNRITVTWTSAGTIPALKVQLLKGGTLVSTLTSSTANDGNQAFTLPFNQAPGSDYVIRLTDTSNAAVTDDSSTFAIRAPVIYVTYPNGGETIVAGSSVNIQWNGDMTLLGRVSIGLYQNGKLVSTISSGTTNDGSQSWSSSLSLAEGTGYSIRVTPLSHPEFNDSSNSTFSIRKPTLTVTSPAAGSSFARSSTMEINWQSDPVNMGQIRVQLYRNGVLVSTIVSGTTNDGSYSWRIPATVTAGAYQIKLSSTTASTITAMSGTFNIT